MQRPVAVAMCRMDQCLVTVVAAAVEYQLLAAAEMSEFVVAVVVAEVRSAQELQQDH